MFNNDSRPKNEPTPLVAHNPKSTPGTFERIFGNYSGPEYTQLTQYIKNEDKSKEEGHYKVAENLRAFLATRKSDINIPFLNVRTIYSFIPYCTENESETELRLAKCIVCLQLLADPNLPMNEKTDIHLLDNFFSIRNFSTDHLNLLFSYGLSQASFQHSFETYIKRHIAHKSSKENASSKTQSALFKLKKLLSNDTSTEEKNKFAHKFQIHPAALDVTEKYNPYILVHQLLKQSYEAYLQADYQNAADQYHEAEMLLNEFQSNENLSAVIAKDYAMRSEKCAKYRKICLLKINNKENSHHTFPLPQFLNAFYCTAEKPRLSNDTASTHGSDEDEARPLIPGGKLKSA